LSTDERSKIKRREEQKITNTSQNKVREGGKRKKKRAVDQQQQHPSNSTDRGHMYGETRFAPKRNRQHRKN